MWREAIDANRMGRGRVELPTHGFSVRAYDDITTDSDNALRLHGGDLAHHLPTVGENADARRLDPDLVALNEAWPNLPPAAREAVMAVFRAVKP